RGFLQTKTGVWCTHVVYQNQAGVGRDRVSLRARARPLFTLKRYAHSSISNCPPNHLPLAARIATKRKRLRLACEPVSVLGKRRAKIPRRENLTPLMPSFFGRKFF